MNIALVSYMGYDGPGVMHAHCFANCLADRGHDVLFLLNGEQETGELMAEPPRYRLQQVGFKGGLLDARTREVVDRHDADIIHLWTPRHLPARVGLEAWAATGGRLLIHYEDDEEFILRHFGGNERFGCDDLGLYRFFWQRRPDPEALYEHATAMDLEFLRQTMLEPDAWSWLHPVVSPVVEKLAEAYTSISLAYRDDVLSKRDQPVEILYPGVDMERFSSTGRSTELRRELGLADRTVLLYSGAIATIHDFTSYVNALPALCAEYPEVVVVQVGRNHIPELMSHKVRDLRLEDHLLLTGSVPHHRMPEYLALADAYLAPVRADDFNAHRLPSKIPEYMAMGRPMLVVDHGFGVELDDPSEVVKVSGDDPEEVERGLRELLSRRSHWQSMGEAAKDKARRLFDWGRNTEKLLELYSRTLAQEHRSTAEGLDPARAVPLLADIGYEPGRSQALLSRVRATVDESSTEGGAKRRPDRPRVLIVTEARIGRRMSGVGIRYLEMSASLARAGCEVMLATLDLGYRPAVEDMSIQGWKQEAPEALLEQANRTDVVVVHGFVLDKLPELRAIDARLVVDLYCPFVFENLELHRDRGVDVEGRDEIHDRDMAVLREQLMAGDHFLCANARQRDWIVGMLTAWGQIRPSTCPPETQTEDVVAVVPFGVGSEPPEVPARGAIKGRWKGVASDDVVLLWGGGLWSWLDPLTPIRAMAQVRESRPDVTLVFLSTRVADESLVTMPMYDRARELAADLGLVGRGVVFNDRDYIPYEDRSAYFLDADIGVCAHFGSLETHFAFRTRILDYLYHGLPILTSEGDHFGQLVAERGLGRALPAEDHGAWAEAILELVEDSVALTLLGSAVRKERERFTWDRAIEPLASYCHEVAAGKPRAYGGGARGRRLGLPPTKPAGVQDEELAGLSEEELYAEIRRRIEGMRTRHLELADHGAAVQSELRRTQEVARIMGEQVRMIQKIPFSRAVWRLVRRFREP